MKSRIFKNMEWWILISSLALCFIGMVALYTATSSSEFDDLKKQIIWFSISIVIMFVMIFVNYDIWAKLSPVFYGISFILLVAVLFTKSINGASSWFNIGFFSFQPGEFAKIVVILFSALSIVRLQQNNKNEINVIWKLLIVLLIFLVPIFLIVLQPDYGTAAAYIFALILMLFVAGIEKKYIITALLISIIAIPLLYIFVLPGHAKSRIDIFLHPESDPKGAGYNVIQSKIAIGAGELTRNGSFKWKSNTVRLSFS